VRSCLCRAIPQVDNQTLVTVLQHPRERTHPFGTARLAALGLRRVEVIVDHIGRVRRDPGLLGSLERTALLYPSASARDVTSLQPDDLPARLLIIDGTWHHARTLYRDVPILQTLPHLTLPSHARSAFKIRRQPHAYCLSTIEAIVMALRALEPATHGLPELLGAFMTMQTEQLALVGQAGRHRKPTRTRESRAIPRALIEGYDGLVVAYVESIFEPAARRHRALLCCTAERLATGERFHRVIRQPAVTDAHLTHLGLERRDVDAGLSIEEFQREWGTFTRKGDHLAAWNQSTLTLLGALMDPKPRSSVALKGAYHNLQRFGGALEEIIVSEALSPRSRPSTLGPARSRSRLDDAIRLAEFLHQHGTSQH
jgi:DTW domain-containing protein